MNHVIFHEYRKRKIKNSSKYRKYRTKYNCLIGGSSRKLERQESLKATEIQKKREANYQYYYSAQYFINYLYSRPYIDYL